MIERARKNAKIGKNNAKDADVAQLVEQLIRNEQVTGSNPAIGSIFIALIRANLCILVSSPPPSSPQTSSQTP